MPFILSLDEGTTSARAALYDSEGRNIGMEALPFHSGYPQPGWVEQDAEEIWRAQIEAARRLIERLRIPPTEIAAAGITNQRETTVVWTGLPARGARHRLAMPPHGGLLRGTRARRLRRRHHAQDRACHRRLLFRQQDPLGPSSTFRALASAPARATCSSATSTPG